MITYFLGATAAMISAYRLQFRWHDHVPPYDHVPAESSSHDDISVQFAVQIA